MINWQVSKFSLHQSSKKAFMYSKFCTDLVLIMSYFHKFVKFSKAMFTMSKLLIIAPTKFVLVGTLLSHNKLLDLIKFKIVLTNSLLFHVGSFFGS